MAVSVKTRKALKKAVKNKRRRRRGSWLFIQQGDPPAECLSKMFTQFAVIILAACGIILANELRLSLSARNLNNNIKELYHTISNTSVIPDIEIPFADTLPADSPSGTVNRSPLLPGAVRLLEINPDTVGYVNVEGTNISLPVVQRKGDDGNDYYLTTAFDGSANKAGTVFLDYRATLTADERSDVLTLYGHNQRDATMFGDLKKYKKDLEFYKAHPNIEFSSNYRFDTYKIFAYFVTATLPENTRDGVVFDYHNYIDLDEQSFDDFIANIMLRSQIVTSVDVRYGDEFLVLSTCSNEFNDSRFVVFARRVRDGESEFTDTSLAVLNPNAKEPDWDVIFK